MEGSMVCMEGAALAAIVKAEGRCQQAGASQMDCDSEGRSHLSCSTDASLGGRLSDSAEQQANKTHHLLRHCLNSGQREEALQHFSSQDVKEAAKEISRMGQRELQGKFKLVYGNTTHSNNNDWLRRKLFEAIGAAPLKANSKSKARKPHSSNSKPKKQSSVEPPARSAAPAVHSALPSALHMMVPNAATSLRCSPKPFRGPAPAAVRIPPPLSGLASKQQQQPVAQQQRAGASRRTACFPPSPVLTHSVLDLHRYEGAISREASDSDEESVREEQERSNNNSSSNSPFAQSAAQQPSLLVLKLQAQQAAAAQQAAQQQQLQSALQQSTATLAARSHSLGLDCLDLGLDSNNDWLKETWGDACDVLGAFNLGAGAPKPPLASPTSSLDDDDVMLLPMDLSAIDTFAFA